MLLSKYSGRMTYREMAYLILKHMTDEQSLYSFRDRRINDTVLWPSVAGIFRFWLLFRNKRIFKKFKK